MLVTEMMTEFLPSLMGMGALEWRTCPNTMSPTSSSKVIFGGIVINDPCKQSCMFPSCWHIGSCKVTSFVPSRNVASI